MEFQYPETDDFRNQFFAMNHQITRNDFYLLFIIMLVVFASAYATALYILQNFPNSADEVDYLYMAKTFSHGRISNEAHPLHNALSPLYVVTHQGRVFSIFPPGWPLLLTSGVLAGVPCMINPIVSALTVPVLFAIGYLIRGKQTAWIAVLLLALSPFFLMNGGSYFSHPSCYLLILLCTLGVVLGVKQEKVYWAFFTGFFASFAFVTRELTSACLLAIPVGYYFFQSTNRLRTLAGIIAGFLPLSIAYLIYNASLTGEWFQPARYLLGSESYGFGERVIRVFDYVEHQYFGPSDAFSHLLNNLGRLFTWTFPGLPLLSVYGIWKFRHHSWTLVFGISTILLLVGYFFYAAEGGNQYGPRFYFESLGFLCLLGADAANDFFSNHRIRTNMKVIICSSLIVLSLLVFAIHAKNNYETIYQRRTLERMAERRDLENALVFVGAKSGDMIQGDLIRNPPNWKNASILYAWDLGPRNLQIRKHFPNREAYIFKQNPQTKTYYMERMQSPLGQDP